MNKALTVAIIMILVAVSAGFAYGYASTSSALSSANSKNSMLNGEISADSGSITQLKSDLSLYINNTKFLNQEVNNSSSLSVLQNAYAHWDGIAIENSSLVMSEYVTNSTLQWIGGPLSGNYSGESSISGVWSKFFALWSAVWFYTPSPPSVNISGSSGTVNAEVQFLLTSYKTPMQVQYLNISYMLNYEESAGTWSISHEVWHIVSSGIVSYPASLVSALQSQSIMGAAFTHWNDIAIENVSMIMAGYANNATLVWIGGPLSGTYNYSEIPTVWTKFSNLWSAVWFYSENPPAVSESNGNYYVNSTVQWVLTSSSTPLQVNSIVTNYSLEFTSGPQLKIVKEVWHIISASLVSYSSASYESLQGSAIGNSAFSHWNAIAIENSTLVMEEYLNNSSLQWIGGKLAGNYTNYSQIETVWNKFFSIWNAVWFYSEAPPVTNATVSGGVVTGGTVTADVQFVVQSASNLSQFSYIDVVYTIHYAYVNGNYYIVSETFDNVQSGTLSNVGTFT
ncbi:MAG: hypothetical protein M1290_05520 [Candidatus Thermoplasmatota archaeon]|jgi:hypothetical protein|nr:hypothetical protein [Candidatus Thermoplasmatota archaeon]MCL5789904.1 hypothetical protein [Candidatus Thermoplasmatota archaeon]